MLVHGRERRQAEAPPDFLEARRVAVLLNEFLEVVENLALALGQWLHVTLRDRVFPGANGLYAKKRRRSTGGELYLCHT